MEEDKRLHQRLADENRVAVTVVSAKGAPGLENQTFFCPTEDLSVGGLKLNVPTHIPTGSTLELRVAILKPLRAFLLHGDVRWSQESGGGRFPCVIGIKFTNLEGPSRALWQDAIHRKLAVSGSAESSQDEEAAG